MRTPPEISITPEIVQVGSQGLFTINIQCINPPFFLAAGQVLAQAILMPRSSPENYNPPVFWAEVVGEDKLMLRCKISCQGSNISLAGMMDTGADVTVIASNNWPSHQRLQPAEGIVMDVGGSVAAQRSRTLVQIEGPEGRIATVHPFVIDSGFTLWDRDLMSQWGAWVEIPSQPWDF